MESSPRGPLICTVDMACVLVPLALDEGTTTFNVTPWGTESGADPILDRHGEVVANVLGANSRGAEEDFEACAMH